MQTDSFSTEADEDPSGVHPRARRNLWVTAVTTVAALLIGGGLLVLAVIIGPRPEPVPSGDPPKASSAGPKPPEVAQVNPVPPAPVAPESFLYKVRHNDTLSGIAHTFGVTLDQLRADNMIAGNIIHPGEELTISCATMASVKPKPCRVGDQ